MRTASLSALIAVVALLAGCATGGGSRPMAQSASAFEPDKEYIAKVDTIARRRNVDVHWINPPRRDPSSR